MHRAVDSVSPVGWKGLEAGHTHVVGAQRKFVWRDGRARNSPSCLFGTPATAIIALRTTLETHIYRLLFAWVVITFVPCLTLAQAVWFDVAPFYTAARLTLSVRSSWSAHYSRQTEKVNIDLPTSDPADIP